MLNLYTQSESSFKSAFTHTHTHTHTHTRTHTHTHTHTRAHSPHKKKTKTELLQRELFLRRMFNTLQQTKKRKKRQLYE